MLEAEGAFDNEVREALKASFFSAFPRAALDRLLSDAVRIDVAAGSVIYRAGDPARVGLIISGLVRVYMTSQRGRQVTITHASPTSAVGKGDHRF